MSLHQANNPENPIKKNPVFNNVQANQISFPNQIGSSVLNYYEEITIPCILSGIFNVNVPTSLRFIRIGKQVTLYIDTAQSANVNGTVTMTFNPGCPIRFAPINSGMQYFVCPIIAIRNNVTEPATFIIAPDTAISIQYSGATAGNCGINNISITWETSG